MENGQCKNVTNTEFVVGKVTSMKKYPIPCNFFTWCLHLPCTMLQLLVFMATPGHLPGLKHLLDLDLTQVFEQGPHPLHRDQPVIMKYKSTFCT